MKLYYGIYPLLDVNDSSLWYIIGQLAKSFDVKL